AGLFDEERRICDYQQRAEPSFHDLSCRDAIFHATELSRFWNARRLRRRSPSIPRMHPIAGGRRAEILLRNSSRHGCDRAIARHAGDTSKGSGSQDIFVDHPLRTADATPVATENREYIISQAV